MFEVKSGMEIQEYKSALQNTGQARMLILCVLAHLRQLLALVEKVGHEKILKKKSYRFLKNNVSLRIEIHF